MPRQPYLRTAEVRKFRTETGSIAAPYAMGRAFHKKRPEVAAQIGECLIAWPEVEMQMALLLSILMKADTDATIAVFLSLRRATARYDAISEAAKATLDAQGIEYISATLKIIRSVEVERNALAHAAWGVSDLIKNGMIWLSANDAVHFNIYARKAAKQRSGIDFDLIANKLFVYRIRDLKEIEKRIDKTIEVLWSIKDYVTAFFDEPTNGARLSDIALHIDTLALMTEAIHQMRSPEHQRTPEYNSLSLDTEADHLPPQAD